MLSPDARTDIERRLAIGDADSMAAVNALLCAAFHLTGCYPITERGTHVFVGQSEKIWDERPGQMRGPTGWLMSPNYTSSVDDACDLVECLGKAWIAEIAVRPDGSQARLHEFDRSIRTDWCSAAPGKRGAALAIVKAVLEATKL